MIGLFSRADSRFITYHYHMTAASNMAESLSDRLFVLRVMDLSEHMSSIFLKSTHKIGEVIVRSRDYVI